MIRLLAPGDGEVYRRIRLEALRADPAAFASRAEDWQDLPTEEWERRLVAIPVFVAFDGDEPVGIMGLMPQTASRTAHRATLIMTYVRASHRGQGQADALLAALFAHARETGLRQVELAVSAENPAAIRFYERAGFAPTGRIPGGFEHDGREIDELLMALRIAP